MAWASSGRFCSFQTRPKSSSNRADLAELPAFLIVLAANASSSRCSAKRQRLMGTEIIGREGQGPLPARDSFAQRPVDTSNASAAVASPDLRDGRTSGVRSPVVWFHSTGMRIRARRVSFDREAWLGKRVARGLISPVLSRCTPGLADGGAIRRKRTAPLKRGHRLVNCWREALHRLAPVVCMLDLRSG